MGLCVFERGKKRKWLVGAAGDSRAVATLRFYTVLQTIFYRDILVFNRAV